jgi:hypothetical protein
MLFAQQRDLSRYAGRNNQGIVFTRPGFERLLAFTDHFDDDVPASVAVHELVHDLSRWFFPVQPPWLAEGLAMYLEDIQIDRAGKRVALGSVSRDSIERLKTATFIPSTSQLFATRESDAVDPRDTASFYLGSWALVHYLIDERPQAFGRFQKALGRLMPWRTAWAQSFPGLTSEALDRELMAYLKAGGFKTALGEFTPPVFTSHVRALAPAEVHGARALLAHTSGQAVAHRELAVALALDPNQLDALTVRFHSLGRQARALRTDIAQRAVQAHPYDARAWLLGALAAPEGSERATALARAHQLDPNHPGVVGLLAERALAQNEPHVALDHVRLAQRRSGVTPRNLALQFAALAASNRCGDAAALLERAALSFGSECRGSASAGQDQLTCTDFMRRAHVTASSCWTDSL